jgi:hypothetical protein
MNFKTFVLSTILVSLTALPTLGCRSTPEEPDEDMTTGEEVEQEIEEGADDTSDAIDEAGDEVDEETD